VRRNSFSVRVAEPWNKLSRENREAKNVQQFKKIAEERVEIVGCKGKKIGWKKTQEVTEHSIEDLKNSWDGPCEEKAGPHPATTSPTCA
jgi:hypothetical protein